MKSHTRHPTIHTRERMEFINITRDVAEGEVGVACPSHQKTREGFMRASRVAVLLLLGLISLSGRAERRTPVHEVSGFVIGVPMGTPMKIEASGTCCEACKSLCSTGCKGTECTDDRCCVLTEDVAVTGDNGAFRFYVESGDYHVIVVEDDGDQLLLFDRFPVRDKTPLPKKHIKEAKIYRSAQARE